MSSVLLLQTPDKSNDVDIIRGGTTSKTSPTDEEADSQQYDDDDDLDEQQPSSLNDLNSELADLEQQMSVVKAKKTFVRRIASLHN